MKTIVIFWIIALGLTGAQQGWTSQYTVNIDTSMIQGKAGAISFDFTSNGPTSFQDSNIVFIFNFSHDGISALPETRGGLVSGDIILLLNPAAFTFIEDDFFLNQLTLPFTSFGTSITFVVQTTEVAPSASNLPDELAFFMLGPDGQAMFSTTDPLGADALITLCIDGTTSGLFNVYEPAEENPPGVINIKATAFSDIIFKNSFE